MKQLISKRHRALPAGRALYLLFRSMKMRIYSIALLAVVHLSLISAKAFRNLFGWDPWLARHPRIEYFVEYYSQLTVMQADYSFFSPNVASDLKVEVAVEDSSGRHVVNPFRIANTAVNTRFQCSIIGFQSIPAAQELIARSWAARVYEKYPTARSVSVRGSTYHLPTLREYREGKRPYYEKVFEISFSTSQGRG